MCDKLIITVMGCTSWHLGVVGQAGLVKPSPQEFTKYTGQQSPAPLLEAVPSTAY